MGLNKLTIVTVGVIVTTVLSVWIGCAERPLTTTTTPSGPSAEVLPSLYAPEPQPLTTQECGRCHTHFYSLIREKGGKHRIACTECHTKFHIYRPGKVKYEDILPKCETCHGQIHGASLVVCSDCHYEAHAPLNIPAEPVLEAGCSVCHGKIDRDIRTHVSLHTDLDCSSCHHTKHGYIPECAECHEPHTKEMTQADCLICHPPHTPLNITYPEDTPQETCASCHAPAYDTLKASTKKHKALSCAKCHPEHRAIPTCQTCHPETHSKAMLERFKTCGECHGVAHDLM